MATFDPGTYAGTLKACYERAVRQGQTRRAEILKDAYAKERARMAGALPRERPVERP